jgi:hypothetical protein
MVETKELLDSILLNSVVKKDFDLIMKKSLDKIFDENEYLENSDYEIELNFFNLLGKPYWIIIYTYCI